MQEDTSGKWPPINKSQFISDMRKYSELGGRFTLIHIGPDHILIKESYLYKNGGGMYLFTDKDGLKAGFHEFNMSNKIKVFTSTIEKTAAYSFFVGEKEMELWIDY